MKACIVIVRYLLCMAMFVCILDTYAHAQDSVVVKYRYPKMGIYIKNDKEFVRQAKVSPDALPTTPTKVLESSPRGYVAIQGDDGLIWLEVIQVVLDPPRKVNRDCDRSIITRPGGTVRDGTYGERGAGENDCK